jgi:hypothetical protein
MVPPSQAETARCCGIAVLHVIQPFKDQRPVFAYVNTCRKFFLMLFIPVCYQILRNSIKLLASQPIQEHKIQVTEVKNWICVKVKV